MVFSTHPPRENDIDNRYRLLAKIGSGGMGDVFLAVQRGAVDFSRLVVLKRIHDRQVEHSEHFAGMFNNEASVVASLNHPHIVKVFDFCVTGSSVSIVMEYVEGETLRYVVSTCSKNQKRVPVGITCRLMLDACDALNYAHNSTSPTGELRRIIHRDIGLHNLMLDSNGYLKIIDFGIAKSDVQSDMTVPGLIKGNPGYMAPDIFMHPDPDHRIDIYAMGLCLYEMLTQARAFKFDTNATVGQIIREISNRQLPQPSKVATDIPLGMDEVIAKAVEKDRTKRYQTIDAFAMDLKKVAGRSLMTGGEIKKWFTTEFAEKLKERRAFGAQMIERARQADLDRNDDSSLQSMLERDVRSLDIATTNTTSSSLRPNVQTSQFVIERNNLYKLIGAILLFFVLSVTVLYFIAFRDRTSPIQEVTPSDNLVVSCIPAGAKLTVDDKELGLIGEAGMVLHVEPNKPHRVVISKEGYHDFMLPFIAPGVGSKHIDATLMKNEVEKDTADVAPTISEMRFETEDHSDETDDDRSSSKKTSHTTHKKKSAAKNESAGLLAPEETEKKDIESGTIQEKNRKIPLPDDENERKIPLNDDN